MTWFRPGGQAEDLLLMEFGCAADNASPTQVTWHFVEVSITEPNYLPSSALPSLFRQALYRLKFMISKYSWPTLPDLTRPWFVDEIKQSPELLISLNEFVIVPIRSSHATHTQSSGLPSVLKMPSYINGTACYTLHQSSATIFLQWFLYVNHSNLITLVKSESQNVEFQCVCQTQVLTSQCLEKLSLHSPNFDNLSPSQTRGVPIKILGPVLTGDAKQEQVTYWGRNISDQTTFPVDTPEL